MGSYSHQWFLAVSFCALFIGPLIGAGERVELELPELADSSLLQVPSVARGASWSDELPLPADAAPPHGQGVEILKITIVNDYHREVLEAGMGTLLRSLGFTANMRLVCTDDASLRWCRETLAHPSHCLRSRKTFGASDFQKNDYTKLIWLKWHVCLQALQWPGVSSVFFLDADVAVFAPFEEHLDTQGVDFMYTHELPDWTDSLNGGQMWFRSADNTLAYMREVLKNDESTAALDQDFAQKALRAPLRWRVLPRQRFQKVCWEQVNATVTDLTLTYHASCRSGADSKRDTLLAGRKSWLQARSQSQGGAAKSPKPLPGGATQLRAGSLGSLGLTVALPLCVASQLGLTPRA